MKSVPPQSTSAFLASPNPAVPARISHRENPAEPFCRQLDRQGLVSVSTSRCHEPEKKAADHHVNHHSGDPGAQPAVPTV